ncbi:hypothetical protein COCOBI_02-3460 [Coccomyxa sp. Obi]|nr:hypothetical protein COCOBI_02-3460 [Coccomyxa sp. Obi]
MYSLIFMSTPSPSPSFASGGMGPQSRGTTGRESRRAPPSMAPGDFLSLWGTGLATQFLWPRPPQTCSAGSHLLGTPGRAAQSCAPQPWRSTPERGRVVPQPPASPIPLCALAWLPCGIQHVLLACDAVEVAAHQKAAIHRMRVRSNWSVRPVRPFLRPCRSFFWGAVVGLLEEDDVPPIAVRALRLVRLPVPVLLRLRLPVPVLLRWQHRWLLWHPPVGALLSWATRTTARRDASEGVLCCLLGGLDSGQRTGAPPAVALQG